MRSSELDMIIENYRSRPAKRSGPALDRARAELRRGVGSAKLEGFEPTDIDNEALELVATGRISDEEFKDLCVLSAKA